MDLSRFSYVLSYLAQTLEAKGIMFILQKSLVQEVALSFDVYQFSMSFPSSSTTLLYFSLKTISSGPS